MSEIPYLVRDSIQLLVGGRFTTLIVQFFVVPPIILTLLLLNLSFRSRHGNAQQIFYAHFKLPNIVGIHSLNLATYAYTEYSIEGSWGTGTLPEQSTSTAVSEFSTASVTVLVGLLAILALRKRSLFRICNFSQKLKRRFVTSTLQATTTGIDWSLRLGAGSLS